MEISDTNFAAYINWFSVAKLIACKLVLTWSVIAKLVIVNLKSGIIYEKAVIDKYNTHLLRLLYDITTYKKSMIKTFKKIIVEVLNHLSDIHLINNVCYIDFLI